MSQLSQQVSLQAHSSVLAKLEFSILFCPLSTMFNDAVSRTVLFLQAIQAAAASSTESLTLSLRHAQASIPRLTSELQSNHHLLQRHLQECQGWADRHQHTVKALRDQTPAELMYPDSHWAAEQAPVQLGQLPSVLYCIHHCVTTLPYYCILYGSCAGFETAAGPCPGAY